MKQIKQMIKEKKFKNIMILYGEETFLLELYKKKMVELILEDGEPTMNFTMFSDDKVSIEEIDDSINTLPFLSKTRIIVLKNIGLFSKKKKLAESLLDSIKKMPDTTYIIIVESTVDKRTKLFREIKKIGIIANFATLGEDELVKYIGKKLGEYQLKIDINDAHYMVQRVGDKLSVLSGEIEKVANYVGEKSIVKKVDIEAICLRSIENKIFELVACLGQKRRGRALKLYHDLLHSKEPANRILFMLVRQFRLNYKVKLYSQNGLNQNAIAKKMKTQSFIIRNCISQNKSFRVKTLEQALIDCYQVELDIRKGIYKPEIAVEQLIIKYG